MFIGDFDTSAVSGERFSVEIYSHELGRFGSNSVGTR
eukprot:SAG31_NODE_1048_length_10166_cov_4.708751_1_plen_36_part_10